MDVRELPDMALFEACVNSQPGPFQDAAKTELISERLYRESDIEDEIDRIFEIRAAQRTFTSK